MDQQVISNFKKIYTKHLFRRCFDITESTNLSLREFWKDHFDIVICLKLIDQSWQEVTRRTLNSSWKKLWPVVVSARDFEGFEEGEARTADDPEPFPQLEVEEIVSLGKSMGLDVSEEDINELIEEHKEEHSTEDLKELDVMKVNSFQEQFSVGEKEEEEEESQTTTAEIKEALFHYEKLQEFLEKRHPEKLHTARILAQFNDFCLSRFRNILKNRQKQTTLDRFFPKKASVSQGEGQGVPQKRKLDEDSD